MEFVEENDNVKRTYSVTFDKEKLEELLDELVKNASYKTEDLFTELAIYVKVDLKNKKIVDGANLPNGDSKYENIEEIKYYTSNGVYGSPNDSVLIEGTKITPPNLAHIIENILYLEPKSIYRFFAYAYDDELVSIDKKIQDLDTHINEISNFNFDAKINALGNLKNLFEKKKSKQYFDVELLKKYYLEASKLISLQLISETKLKDGPKVLLKDYKFQNNK